MFMNVEISLFFTQFNYNHVHVQYISCAVYCTVLYMYTGMYCSECSLHVCCFNTLIYCTEYNVLYYMYIFVCVLNWMIASDWIHCISQTLTLHYIFSYFCIHVVCAYTNCLLLDSDCK
jgi:hypothetical protein